MRYGLGIDVGTTFTAAALDRDGNVEVFTLATYQVAIPSVIFAEGDEMLFGGPAERRGAAQPLGLAREFKRRLGDPVPIMLSGSPYHADRLTALMAKWVTDSVTDQIGTSPTQIVLTHPANWTEYQLGTLRNALVDVGQAATELISEPAAAALDYSAATNLESGATVLVYDLGGGTFDVALLRRNGQTFEHEIEPAGIERLGGIDFDEAVFEYVRSMVPQEVMESARQHPEGAAAIAQLRRRCVDAKEALSSDVTSEIPIMLPDYTATIRITRPEFEGMIRPMIRQTIEVVGETLGRARIDPASLDAILLVGGSSRIPLVPQMVAEQLGLPVRIDAHPKLVVAKGAARRAGLALPAAPKSNEPRDPRRSDDKEGDAEKGRGLLVKLVILAVVAFAAVGGVYWFLHRSGSKSTALPASSLPASSLPASSLPASSLPASSTSATVPFAPFAATSQVKTLQQPIDLEVVGTDLWVMSQVEGTLQRFDTTQPIPQLVETVPLGFKGGRNGNDIIPVDGALYVTQFDAQAVARVDLKTSPPTVTSIPVPGRPLNGTVQDGTVWVTLQPRDASVEPMALLPINGTIVGKPVPMGQVPYQVDSIDGELWVTFDDDDRIGHFDPSSDPSDMKFIDELEHPIDLLPVEDDVWVTLTDRDQVAVIRKADGVIRNYVETGGQPFKIIGALGSVWVTNTGSGRQPGSVSRLGPINRRPQQPLIQVGFAPIEMAAGPDRIFVANFGSATISVLAPAP